MKTDTTDTIQRIYSRLFSLNKVLVYAATGIVLTSSLLTCLLVGCGSLLTLDHTIGLAGLPPSVEGMLAIGGAFFLLAIPAWAAKVFFETITTLMERINDCIDWPEWDWREI